jgi:hypothetical protein
MYYTALPQFCRSALHTNEREKHLDSPTTLTSQIAPVHPARRRPEQLHVERVHGLLRRAGPGGVGVSRARPSHRRAGGRRRLRNRRARQLSARYHRDQARAVMLIEVEQLNVGFR